MNVRVGFMPPVAEGGWFFEFNKGLMCWISIVWACFEWRGDVGVGLVIVCFYMCVFKKPYK